MVCTYILLLHYINTFTVYQIIFTAKVLIKSSFTIITTYNPNVALKLHSKPLALFKKYSSIV